MSARISAAALAAALAATLTACGSAQHATDTHKAVSETTTNCANTAAAKAVALPPGFPAEFPLPPGTVITTAQDRGAAGLVVSGVTSTGFADVLHALQINLPAKGFTPKDGETEPHDAESDWSSMDHEGRWAIREITQCPGDTIVSVVARKK